jgi:thiamine-monophosphate kinase
MTADPGDGSGSSGVRTGERDALRRLARLLPPAPGGEVWFGDDAAVVGVPGTDGLLLLAADAVVAGLDADLELTSLADLGWKAMAVNLSDIAAMGGRPRHALVSVVGLRPDEIEALYAGVVEAAEAYACPVVGGDLSGGAQAVVSVAITGWCDGPPVLRRGARPGDSIWVTGPLGAAAAGLRWLQATPKVELANGVPAAALVRAHARPRPALAAGEVARRLGATAMIDVSDGFVADLTSLAEASGVGFALTEVPVAEGATLEEALAGGDDYVLVFTLPSGADALVPFAERGVSAPYRVGSCLGDPGQRLLAGRAVAVAGWEHQL